VFLRSREPTKSRSGVRDTERRLGAEVGGKGLTGGGEFASEEAAALCTGDGENLDCGELQRFQAVRCGGE
jgi:hypothetical protein